MIIIPESTDVPAWAQPGITHVTEAEAFLRLLRRRDVLCGYGGDAECGFPVNYFNDRNRGHGVCVSTSVLAATPPAADLLAYHHTLGLGPERVICPAFRPRMPLAQSCLADEPLLRRLRADATIRGLFFRHKGVHEQELAARLGLEFMNCGTAPQTYAAVNDKAALAQAGETHGFDTLPLRVTTTPAELELAFQELHTLHGEGCILRLRHGAGGHGLAHAPTLGQARLIWRRLRAQGEVLVVPFIPRRKIRRNLSLHGFVTQSSGFAPLFVMDQLIHGFGFRGARCDENLTLEERAAVRASLPGLGAWLRAAGYVDAPAGVDGFLMQDGSGLRFVIVDPNIRVTNSMRPWSVVATLSERAGRRFLWRFEMVVVIGPVTGMRHLRQRLGADLLDASRLQDGGILPSLLGRFGLGPLGALRLEVVMLGRDAAHLAHLRRRIGDLGFRWR